MSEMVYGKECIFDYVPISDSTESLHLCSLSEKALSKALEYFFFLLSLIKEVCLPNQT